MLSRNIETHDILLECIQNITGLRYTGHYKGTETVS